MVSLFLVRWVVRFVRIERRMWLWCLKVIYVCVFMISRTGSIANEIKAFNVVLRVLNPSADRMCTRLTLPIVTLRRIKTCFVKAIIDLSFCLKRVETEKKNTMSRNYSFASDYYLSGQGSSVFASTWGSTGNDVCR